MSVLWRKLQIIRPVIKKLQGQVAKINEKVGEARKALEKAQQDLKDDLMNKEKLEEERKCRKTLFKWRDIEEKILAQKAKIKWPQLGDENYFHAIVKEWNKSHYLASMEDDSGRVLSTVEDIEEETLKFYHSLVSQSENRNELGIVALREGRQVLVEDRRKLVLPITREEIIHALKQMGGDKASG